MCTKAMRRYYRLRFVILTFSLVLVSFLLIVIKFHNIVNLNENEDINEEFSEVVIVKTPIFKKRRRPVPCQDLKQPWGLADEDSWQPIGFKTLRSLDGESREAAYIFSAYYEDAESSKSLKQANSIRIVGIYTSEDIRQGLLCQVWFMSKRELSVVPATYIDIPEGIDKLYKPCFFRCPIITDEVPYAVSLVRKKCKRPTNFLSVHRAKKASKRKFTVCVSPLYHHFNDVHQLIEMVETNRLFGAEKFIFYNHSAGPAVDKVLTELEKESVADIVQWRIPVRVNSKSLSRPAEVHYYGQLPALNDCLFRESFSEFIVFTDLDELIVPRQHKNWEELLQEVDNVNQAISDIYVFRCVFFRKDWPNTQIQFQGRSLAEKYRLVTLLKLTRERSSLPYYRRSKLIVRPEAVLTVGIHNVWRHVPMAKEALVHEDLAVLHHYRDWSRPEDTNRFLDKTMHRFLEDILFRVKSRWKKHSAILV